MQLWEKQSLFALNVSYLIKEIHDKGLSCTLGEAFRTAEQAKIYAIQGKGIIDSLHCERLAIDINLFASDGTYLTGKIYYEPFGAYWKKLCPNNRWGGDFDTRIDSNHFEMQNK